MLTLHSSIAESFTNQNVYLERLDLAKQVV